MKTEKTYLSFDKRDQIPHKIGVYFFYDHADKLLYIGKSNDLHDRIYSHFSSPKDALPKNQILIPQVKKIAYSFCDSEIEALIFEASLIKKYLPKFNVKLRDDKAFSYLVITKEKFPRVFISRKLDPATGDMIGPFTDRQTLSDALKFIRNILPFRDCKKFPKKPCLQFDLGRCPAPCAKDLEEKEYQKNILLLKKFFTQGPGKIKSYFFSEMKKASQKKDFEKAANFRDKIKVLEKLKTYQKISKVEKEKREGLGAVKELYKFLNIHEINGREFDVLNYRIEGYDISNISGTDAVGSMVVNTRGKPDKSKYRKFKIKTVQEIDDYQMMKEVLLRRFGHTEWKKPGLIVIDGGRGHLNSALEVLKKLNLDIFAIALAKRLEAVYLPNKIHPEFLPRNSAALYLLQRIRDEAHRFGKRYFLTLHGKRALSSELEKIAGVGEETKIKLLKHFGSLDKIKKANFEELSRVVNRRLAKRILNELKN